VQVWLDAQLPPTLAGWMAERFGLIVVPVRALGLRDASDEDIYAAAQRADVVVTTKDVDFVRLQERLGPPPRLVWLTCGNTSNAVLRTLLARHWTAVAGLLDRGNPLVEVGPLEL
jgi:predicted nuclease of predicted toxin-antitoxin system